MIKIAIFQADLKVGGIQSSLYNLLMSNFFDDNYFIDVYLFSDEVFYDITHLKTNIHIHYLKPFPYVCRFIPFKLLKLFFRRNDVQLNNYDIVIDYDSYRPECAYYCSKANNSKKIMWVHNDMSLEYKYNKKYRILYYFFKNKYIYYDQFVAVSQGVVEPFMCRSKQTEKKIWIIPNIIDVERIEKLCNEPLDIIIDEDAINVVCVGKIHLAKGYDYLLKDFESAIKKNNLLRLYIIGDGPDKKKYENWVNKHNLSCIVTFLGNRVNPFNVMNKMDAFCLESRYEGQGMVFWEAKALGLKIIFPKHLEKYNNNLIGSDNIVNDLVTLQKKEKKRDTLIDYHKYIFSTLNSMFING